MGIVVATDYPRRATGKPKAFAVYIGDMPSCDPASRSPGLRAPHLRGCARIGRGSAVSVRPDSQSGVNPGSTH